MKNLSSYVPEALRFLEKRQKPSRVCFEGCAVLEPAKRFRILASRGIGLEAGENFLTLCGVSPKDAELFDGISPRRSRVLMPAQKGTVLLLADLFWDTSLLFGVLLPFNAESVFRGLHRIGQQDFICPERLFGVSAALQAGEEELCQQLDELFYYVTRIFEPKPETSLWTRCLLIANFAGCRLERVALPIQAPLLSKRNESCMTLFLLCSFLTLRQKNGRVEAEGEPAKPWNYRCKVSLVSDSLEDPDASEHSDTNTDAKLPFFLSAPCFENLTATFLEGEMRLEMHFPILQKDGKLCSLGSDSAVCLLFYVSGVFSPL